MALKTNPIKTFTRVLKARNCVKLLAWRGRLATPHKSQNDTQHSGPSHLILTHTYAKSRIFKCYAECHYAECRNHNVGILGVAIRLI
jgi:hypothetical protein